MGDTNSSGGGKSTLVQAPQKTAAPVKTSVGGGYGAKASKKNKGMTAADYQMPTPPKPEIKTSWASAPVNPYPLLTRNDLCGCGSGKKYKRCCLK